MNAKVRELGMVGGCFYNDFGVRAFELTNGQIRLEGHKLTRRIPNFTMIISERYFESRFRDENKTGFQLFLDAIEFVNPAPQYEE